MKAIRIHHYGDRSVLRCEDAPEPALHPGDVLIRVHAAGVNPADWQFRRGDFQAFAPMQFPAILGWDVAGIVERVGASARGFRPGDRVYAMCDMGRDGAYAEFIAVQAEHVAPAPAGISLAHCAAAPPDRRPGQPVFDPRAAAIGSVRADPWSCRQCRPVGNPVRARSRRAGDGDRFALQPRVGPGPGRGTAPITPALAGVTTCVNSTLCWMAPAGRHARHSGPCSSVTEC